MSFSLSCLHPRFTSPFAFSHHLNLNLNRDFQLRCLSFARTRASIRRSTREKRERVIIRRIERSQARRSVVTRNDGSKVTPRLPITEAVEKCWEENAKYRKRGMLYLSLKVRPIKQVNMNAIRGRIFLPNTPYIPKGKKISSEVIAVFAEGKAAEDARAMGAEHVGTADMLQEILQGIINPSKIICTPSQERLFKGPNVGRILGPKGLIPSKRRGTVTDDISKAIIEARSGIDFKADTYGLVRLTLNGDRLNQDKRLENVRHVLSFVSDVANGGSGDFSKVKLKKGKFPGLRTLHVKGFDGKGVFVTDM